MTAPVRFIILILLVVVAAAAFMAPRLDEWLAMMRDDNRQAEIIALLEPRLAHNKDDPGLLATLGRSYAEIGNNPRATELLERYLALRPDDGEAYGRLADLARAAGNAARRIAMLKRSVALTPRLSRVAELAGIYREQGQADEELALLSPFETELTVENGLLLRLAQLLAGNGERDRAVRVLMRPEVLSAPARQIRNDEERLLLASLLVQTGRSGEAVRLGKQWIAQWREPWLDNRLLGVVVPSAPVADAAELAEAVAVLHPEVRFFLVHGLVQTGAPLVARHLLETWSTANPSPSMNEIAGFLSACREQDAPDIVWQAFGAALRTPASTDLITRYSEAIAAEFGIGALAPFWTDLPQAVTQRRPLLAARLAFHENNPAMAKWLLARVDVAALDGADRRMWSDLLTAVASPAEVFEVLRDLRRGGNFPMDFLTQYARLAAGFGQEIEYRAALAELRRNVE
jgi:Flp pilus assembly protein TadD